MARDGHILEVEGVRKAFGGAMAVMDVSLELARGEILGVIGPNGSGKTTLVNLITGFVRKDAGRVRFNGADISDLPPHKIADAGLVRTFQVVRPFHSLPAFKNLIPPLFSPRRRRTASGGHGDRDAVAIDVLETVGFERTAQVPYKLARNLPLGYLKRLELAKCLAMNPELILCDEVFSGLSAAEIASMVPLIERLKMRGISIIMVEHRLRELFRVADRVMVMNFGEKIADGPPKDVMKQERVREAYLGHEVSFA